MPWLILRDITHPFGLKTVFTMIYLIYLPFFHRALEFLINNRLLAMCHLCVYLFFKLLEFISQASPVSLSYFPVPLTPKGPGLSQSPALLCLTPRLLSLICSPG